MSSFENPPRTRAPLWLGVAIAVLAATLYIPRGAFFGTSRLQGMDFDTLHQHRLDYARTALASEGQVPAWYTRELLGTPFVGNVQNFPFLPTRLALLAFDPRRAYAVGVAMAAFLSALFTYLFARKVGLDTVPATAAAWTFASSGFFASRVAVGHLPLLEACFALPLLLWLSERVATADTPRPGPTKLLPLSAAAATIALAGHPQVPAYALAGTGAYLLFRGPWRRTAWGLAALVLGVLATSAVWWPMALLVGRSTRSLNLALAENDVVLPLSRLVALVDPWRDGSPGPMWGPPDRPLLSTLRVVDFWETADYVGLLPLMAVAVLGALALAQRRWPGRPFLLVLALSGVGLAAALPLLNVFRDLVPGTLFRSPARAFYLPTFGLALAFGAAVGELGRLPAIRSALLRRLLVGAVLFVHALDLGPFARSFVVAGPVEEPTDASLEARLRGVEPGGRVAVDRTLIARFSHARDDVGAFDSIFLARTYQSLMGMSGEVPQRNIQHVQGTRFSPGALAQAGAHWVVTPEPRTDLGPDVGVANLKVYAVPGPEPRLSFVNAGEAVVEDEQQMLERQRQLQGVGLPRLFLPPGTAMPPVVDDTGNSEEATVAYERPSSDRVVGKVRTPRAGFLKLIESFDPGWSAVVDGRPSPVLPASYFAMAVAVSPGDHTVVWQYRTPGRALGLAITFLAVAALGGLVTFARKSDRRLGDGK